MIKLWRVLIAVLVVSVFAGIAMQFAAIVSIDAHGVPGGPVPAMLQGLASLKRYMPTMGGEVDMGGTLGREERLKLNIEVIKRLRDRYGKVISDPRVQVQAIEEIRGLMGPSYAGDRQHKMGGVLRAVFPEGSGKLLEMSVRLDLYDAWLKGATGMLLGLDKAGREGAIWAKRREIFGSEAKRIWAAEKNTKTISHVLAGLNRIKGISLEDKLAFFEGSIRQEYGQDADAYIKSNQQELQDRFLGLESVQADLKGMQPARRRLGLKAIRQAMGMDADTILRLEALDKIRDGRWERGLMYMEQRQRIKDSVQGETRVRMLNELRQRYFGDEAAILAGEEGAGYFRFKVKRQYGLN